MTRQITIRLALAATALTAAVLGSAADAAMQAGETAPAFTIPAAKGGKVFTFDLAAALKKGPVVLYFYPKSFTSVCTLEAHAFADAMPRFAAAGASVIGVSADGIETQQEFSSKECRDTFPVGADASLDVARAYDVALAIPGTGMGFANRVSFVIAPDGRILEEHADSGAESHIATALAAVEAWRRNARR